MYSLEQLKIFVTICEEGSFSAAARQLKRAQSGVSQAISNLEIAINQELFSREKNIPSLTSQGKALLPIAKSILHQQQFFDQKVESLAKGAEHELVIAIDESVVNDELMTILSPLANQFPITDVEIIITSTFDVEELVRVGQAHIGIIYVDGELKTGMDFFTLGHARFLTIASPQHPLSALSSVTESDLQAHRQCVHRSAHKKELWFSYKISPTAWYANSHMALIELVKNNIGWAVVPELLAHQQINNGSVISLPVSHEFDGWLTVVGCLVSRRHASGPVLEKVVKTLKDHSLLNKHWTLKS
ncbi:LysR family transcriptional regulator [Psychromonas sp. SA13A]|uniref:LysR family transcriptional regulator n=1 Tax=Psychromonas sp. SA13A TaxID=2686346 RepID=UPI0014074CF2|nr:LysR family transcriptional regulator [Psychromonas sp. SA13A]